MKIKKTDTPKKQQSRKSSFWSFQIIAVATLLLVILLFFLWHKKNSSILTGKRAFNNLTVSEEHIASEPLPPINIKNQNSASAKTTNIEKSNTPTTSMPAKPEISIVPSLVTPPVPQTTTSNPPPNNSPENVNTVPQEVAAAVSPDNKSDIFSKTCSNSTKIIRYFYNHLDTQEYMKEYGIKGKSENHFTSLIQKLLDNPPVVSGETNDLFTILQNTAHFFRIIGKNNILILKGILDREKDQFENVLNHFYSIFHTPSCPKDSFGLQVTKTSLYEYAGFFLNTMGGRLYLFRRDSKSRMVVSYYAILLIDQANKEARNKDGIEVQTAIDQLIVEMEASSNQLKLEQLYLDNLYDLKEIYQ